jgi:hypothetical protein
MIFDRWEQISNTTKISELRDEGRAMRDIRVLMTMSFLVTHTAGLASPVEGPGTTTCAQFSSMLRANSGIEDTFFTWAQGYMSALNMNIVTSKLPARELADGVATQKATIRSYCAENSLKSYMDGVIELYKKLPHQKL